MHGSRESQPQAITEARPPAATPKIGVVAHVFYPDIWPEIAIYLRRWRIQFRLYVTVSRGAKDIGQTIRKEWPDALITPIENRGRDIAAFLGQAHRAIGDGIELLCKVHTKRSRHIGRKGTAWRRDLYRRLLGGDPPVAQVIDAFLQNPTLGILGPEGHVLPHTIHWTENAHRVLSLAARMGHEGDPTPFMFPAGAMFWIRSDALTPILDLCLAAADFEEEAAQLDGTLAHALERLFPIAARLKGFTLADTSVIPRNLTVGSRLGLAMARTRLGLASDMLTFFAERSSSMLLPLSDPLNKLLKMVWRDPKNREIAIIKRYGLVDEAWYLQQNPDIARVNMDPVVHYVYHGAKEGRHPHPDFRAPLASAAAQSPPDRAPKFLTRAMFDQVRKAIEYEPEIGDISALGASFMPPFHDQMYHLHRAIRTRIPAASYDTVICVPWIRQGGADVLSCSLARSMLRIQPDANILMALTNSNCVERRDWVPEGIDLVDLSDLFAQTDRDHAERLCYAMFSGLGPRRIVNINSTICWNVFKRFGVRLADRMNLYAYLFCWDMTEQGFKVGYPSYYPHTGAFLSALFTDTVFLKEELTKLYSVPPMLRDRIVPLFSPARFDATAPTMAERAAATRSERKRPIVLWGGRFDRQKRLDIMEAVAARMRHVDFICYGAPMMDQAPQVSNFTKNVSIRGPFKSIEELPLHDIDAWLFTSAWEGMPLILIELALKGVPIVASAVGGVPELITNETGWPVYRFEDIDEYVGSLEQAIANPAMRIQRAKNLQRLAQAKHSPARYDKELRRVFSQEKQRD